MTIQEIELPSQSIHFKNSDGTLTHVSVGGAILKMPVKRGWQLFELHSYFGPWPLRKDEEPAQRAASDFWPQYYKWVESGKLVSGDECVIK